MGNPHCVTPTPTPAPTGSIRIEKIALDASGNPIATGSFTFNIDGSAKSPAVAGGSGQTYGNIPTGTHTITEASQAGWTNLGGTILSGDATSCFDRGSEDDEEDEDDEDDKYSSMSVLVDSPSLEVKVKSGDTVVVCWTNKQVETPRTGTITIVKVTDPANDPQNFNFSGTGPSGFNFGGGFALDTDTSSLAPSQRTYSGLTAGTYEVTEDLSPTGWLLTNLVCNDANSTGNTGTRTATINVAAGEHVTCTFTNSLTRIIIEKVTNPAEHAQNFTFSGTGPDGFSFEGGFQLDTDPASLAQATRTFASLKAGTYTVTELANLSAWSLTGLVCNDPSKNSTVNLTSRTATINLALGETVTCTFTNTLDTPPPPVGGSIRVEKIVYDAKGVLTSGGSFTFLVDGNTKSPAVAGGGSQTYGSLTVGTHAVTEQGQAGWTNLGGATLNQLEAQSCRSAFEGAPAANTLSLSVNASVSADATTVVCWFNRQTTTPPPTCEGNCGGGISETSDPGPAPTPAPTQVRGSSAQITKVLSSANPARIGERVTFTVTLTVTGDTPVTGIQLVDTFEHTYLRFVGSAPGGCVSTPVDAARSQVICAVPDITPGTPGNPGTKSVVYMLTFDALAVTTRTVDSVIARADLDGTGPAQPTTIGPATDGVPIIGLPTGLPKAGDGELVEAISFTQNGIGHLTLASVLLAFAAAGAVALRGSRLWS